MENYYLKKLYYEMLRIRCVEEMICEEYPKQEMRCPVHLSIGQEAIAVGVCAALQDRDVVFSTHRAHAHYLAQGGNLEAMLAELYLRKTGTCNGKGGSMHLIDRSVGFYGGVPIVGSGIAVAVGAALGFVMQQKPGVAISFFGEAATEEGVFSESLNFAALKKLPVVFICENNLYSVNSPLSVRQPAERQITAFAEALNVPAEKGDGNDVKQVYQMTAQAVEGVRRSRGPRFLEFDTYRWREHCGPNYDFDMGYRTEAEFNVWKLRDPLLKTGEHLRIAGVVDDVEMERMHQEIKTEIEAAFSFAQNSPPPVAADLYHSIYAD